MCVSPASCWAPRLSQSLPRGGRCPLFTARGPLWWDNRDPTQARSPRGTGVGVRVRRHWLPEPCGGREPSCFPAKLLGTRNTSFPQSCLKWRPVPRGPFSPSFTPRAGRLPDLAPFRSRRLTQKGAPSPAAALAGTPACLWGSVAHPVTPFQRCGVHAHTSPEEKGPSPTQLPGPGLHWPCPNCISQINFTGTPS